MKRDPGLASTIRTLFGRSPSRERIDAFRERRLRCLIRHAYENVPYYHDVMRDRGLRPDDIRGVADLPKLPLLTRRAVQATPPERMLAEGADPKRLMGIASSGSMGRKVTVYRTPAEFLMLGAVHKRSDRGQGRSPRLRLANVGVDRGEADLPVVKALMALGFFRMRTIECRQEPERIIEQLRAYRPDMVASFPTILARVAEIVGPGGLADLRVKSVVLGGETVSPAARARVKRAFDAPVYETYGSVEFFTMAWECPESGQLHVNDDSVILEVLRDDRPAREGETGEAVVTNLHQFAMPLIRYAVGDLVVQGSGRCPCGSAYSTIQKVQGRSLDYFPLPDGRRVHHLELVVPMVLGSEWIGQYRQTQERPDRFVLEIEPLAAPTKDQIDFVRRHYESVLGPRIDLRIELVDRMPLDPNGKFRTSRPFVSSGARAPSHEPAPAPSST